MIYLNDQYDKLVKQIIKFERENNVNRLGIYKIRNSDFVDITNESLSHLMFGQVGREECLSRGKLYYDIKSGILQFNNIVNLVNVLHGYPVYVKHAVYEYVLKYTSIVWYQLWIDMYKNDNLVELQERVLAQVYNIAEYILLNLESKHAYNNLDLELLEYAWTLIRKESIQNYDIEYDHILNVVKEICFMDYIVDINKVQLICFPLFGAFYESIFHYTINKLYGRSEVKLVTPKVGVHNKISVFNTDSTFILPQRVRDDIREKYSGQTVLIMDDNIGSGETLSECTKFFGGFNCECLTRVSEIPWDFIKRADNNEHIAMNLNIPTLKSNMRYLTKSQYIKAIMQEDYIKIQDNKKLNNNFIDDLKDNFDSIINKAIWSKEQIKYFHDEKGYFQHIYERNI